MGWTDADTVRKHLLSLDNLPTVFKDVEVSLDSAGKAYLPHRGIESGSAQVKVLKQLLPNSQSGVTLSGETWVALSYDDLVPGEIVVASDDGLGTAYQLDSDYCFNPADGKLRRISGGSISDGASVEVYYKRYEVKTAVVDFTIDLSTGVITRVPTGDLEIETNIYVDYEISDASAVDELMTEALTEAENKILGLLKSEYTIESSDRGLITGATELTLSIICRGLAMRALSDGRTAAEGRSRAWRNLSQQYESQAWITLQSFLAVHIPTGGTTQGNSNWEWQ
ncbi:MAG: hypothetical protein HN356_01725 [Calditrichaeota bacterium]|jgi:hypothetical protein|nr:hypothetical protein [Calditrichota bacterium]MBT7618397.1 hypothetical protein [Calditrichota bacterium]MBT7788092.1 hypothetical protein [Calditrichota bacterium]